MTGQNRKFFTVAQTQVAPGLYSTARVQPLNFPVIKNPGQMGQIQPTRNVAKEGLNGQRQPTGQKQALVHAVVKNPLSIDPRGR